MKIGILTYHMALNYGAFWQAYALNKFIEENLEVDCYLIHYESKYTFKQDIIKRVFKFNLLKGVYNLFAIYGFSKGWRKMRKTAFSFEVKNTFPNEFGAYILGSDEIWNYKNPFVKQDDYTYFGDKFESSKIITYCPSFGTVSTNEQIPEEVISCIRRMNPNNISVRDKNSQFIIEKMTGRRVPILVDPVFLYRKPENKQLSRHRYILVYGNNFSKDFIDAIKEVAKQEKAKIYSFGFFNNFADRNILCKSPLEIVKYFNTAQYVFTNMYHGVVFSLHYKKPFWMQHNAMKQNKVATLLEYLGLSDRIVNNSYHVIDSYNYVKKNPQKYNESLELLENMIEQSKSFIKDRIMSLQNAGNKLVR